MTTRRNFNESPVERRLRLERSTSLHRESVTHADFNQAMAIKIARRAIKLTIVLSPMGFWTIGLVLKNGHVVGDGYVDVLVMTMGALDAIYFLQRWTRRLKANGDQAGPLIDHEAVQIVFGEDEVQ